jgi:predicted nucleotidyltransferase
LTFTTNRQVSQINRRLHPQNETHDTQRATICEEVQRHFGENACALLFGSRIRDDALGGDIDLYIEAEGSVEDMLDRELKFYAALQRRLGEQRIDTLVRRRGASLRPIDIDARKTGVPLWPRPPGVNGRPCARS